MTNILHESSFISLIDSTEEENRALAEQHFTGNLLLWASQRIRFLGDYIVPKIVYIGELDREPHKVAWVEHHGLNTTTQEIFHNHHVVCECVLCKKFDDGEGGIDTTLCEVMAESLTARAQVVGADFQSDIAAYQYYGSIDVMTGSSQTKRIFDIESLSLSALEKVLCDDNLHPETWHGNVISGSLPVEQAGRIIDQPLDLTIRCAELLRKSGKADFDGETLRLAA